MYIWQSGEGAIGKLVSGPHGGKLVCYGSKRGTLGSKVSYQKLEIGEQTGS